VSDNNGWGDGVFEHTWSGSCLCDDRGCLSMHGGVTCGMIVGI